MLIVYTSKITYNTEDERIHVEPIAISQQPTTKASWSSNLYIYYKQFRNKVLSINLLNNKQNKPNDT